MALEASLRDLWALAFLGGVSPERQFVMIYTGYFDESGTHAASEAMAVAGYISTSEGWLSFDVEWRAALKEYGLDFFHMTDFANSTGPYKAWSASEKEARLERLLGIIDQYALASLGIAVPVKLFHSVVSDKAKRITGGPYGLAVHRGFLHAADLVKAMHADGWIRYVFERGAEGAGHVLRSYNRASKHHGLGEILRQAGLSFEDKRSATPLQAADILAYELRKHLPKTLGLDPYPPRSNHSRLTATPHCWVRLKEADLAEWSAILSSFDENAMKRTVKSGKQRKRRKQ